MKRGDLEKIEEVKKSLGIREDTKLAFSGILFDIWQWKQELFDGTFKTFELMSRIPTVMAIVVTPDKKIIIQKERQPGKKEKLTTPGGRAESYLETWEETNDRELREELQMEVLKSEKLGEWLEASGKNKWKVSVVLVTEYKKLDIENPELWGEKIEPLEVSVEEFFKMAKNWEFPADKLLCEFVTRNRKNIEEKIENML